MSDSDAASADLGVLGLAVMGSNLARNFARHGHRVALFNRTPSRTRELVAEHGDEGVFLPSEDLAGFVAEHYGPDQIFVLYCRRGKEQNDNCHQNRPTKTSMF